MSNSCLSAREPWLEAEKNPKARIDPVGGLYGISSRNCSSGVFFFKQGMCCEENSMCHSQWITLPETNSSPLKIGHPKRKLVVQPPGI